MECEKVLPSRTPEKKTSISNATVPPKIAKTATIYESTAIYHQELSTLKPSMNMRERRFFMLALCCKSVRIYWRKSMFKCTYLTKSCIVAQSSNADIPIEICVIDQGCKSFNINHYPPERYKIATNELPLLIRFLPKISIIIHPDRYKIATNKLPLLIRFLPKILIIIHPENTHTSQSNPWLMNGCWHINWNLRCRSWLRYGSRSQVVQYI